jgi:Hypoxia induced protein conserved region
MTRGRWAALRPARIPVTMSSNTLVLLACLAVAVVLFLGLANMMRGGSANVSQKLMRLRVLLQFVAILVIMGVVWWRSA